MDEPMMTPEEADGLCYYDDSFVFYTASRPDHWTVESRRMRELWDLWVEPFAVRTVGGDPSRPAGVYRIHRGPIPPSWVYFDAGHAPETAEYVAATMEEAQPAIRDQSRDAVNYSLASTDRLTVEHIQRAVERADLVNTAVRLLEQFPHLAPMLAELIFDLTGLASPSEVLERVRRRVVEAAELRHRVRQTLILMNGSNRPQILGGRHVRIAGDEESVVPADTVEELVAFAKAGRREDFDFLAGAAGIPQAEHGALWDGTRARLGLV